MHSQSNCQVNQINTESVGKQKMELWTIAIKDKDKIKTWQIIEITIPTVYSKCKLTWALF